MANINLPSYDWLLIQREWNVSLGSADVSWGGVRAIRTAAKEIRLLGVRLFTSDF